MPLPERKIVFTTDLDGVLFKAPPPLKTTLRLLRGDFPLPAEGNPTDEPHFANSRLGTLLSRWSSFFHQIRPIRPEALAGLELFRQIAEVYQRELRIVALSGRGIDKQAMTEKRLRESGHLQYFDSLFFNHGISSSGWKESVVRKFVKEGAVVVHIDDDLSDGLCLTRINQNDGRVQVYILRNLSNHPRLLKRAGVQIPDNLLLAGSFQEAANDFEKRLNEGSL